MPDAVRHPIAAGRRAARRALTRTCAAAGRALAGGDDLPLLEPCRRLELPVHPDSCARARALVDSVPELARSRRRGDLRLLISELVTNSVEHTGPGAGTTITLEARLHGDRVRVDVLDCGREFAAPTTRTGPAGGWGLILVERLSDRWGLVRAQGTQVWFELSLASASPA